LAEADKNAKRKDVPLGMLKADGSSKRYGSVQSVHLHSFMPLPKIQGRTESMHAETYIRFYKAAGVAKIDQDDPRTGTLKTMWSLTLDGRGVRTPANKLLTLPNKNMAMAIALEFDVQVLSLLSF